VPALTGNGLAMRAAQVLMALSRHYRVSLLVAAQYPSPAGRDVPAEIAASCREVVVVPAAQALVTTIALRDAPFDVVHVFRLGTVPYAESYLDEAPVRHLDLDDVESSAHRRMATLHHQHRNRRQAQIEERIANATAIAEAQTLPRFDRIYVCADGDIGFLPRSVQTRAFVLPNVVSVPTPLPTAPGQEPVELLFVGTLGYFPNTEGITWFAEKVLPLVRRRAKKRVVVRIVGREHPPLVSALASRPGVDFVGYAPDLLEWYARCRLVVVPIRAGGGTRIKILEAFAMRRPVVATTIGAEGIDARDGEHLLLADDRRAFAASCARLIDDPALGERLTAGAFALVSARYTPEAAARCVAPGPAPPTSAGADEVLWHVLP
jgi:glycosyltransferase involved in cell wall biosynthesis